MKTFALLLALERLVGATNTNMMQPQRPDSDVLRVHIPPAAVRDAWTAHDTIPAIT